MAMGTSHSEIADQIGRLMEKGVYNVTGEGVPLVASFVNGEMPGCDGLEVSPSDAAVKPFVYLGEEDDESPEISNSFGGSFSAMSSHTPADYYCLILYDPDAPVPQAPFLSDISHWVVWNCRNGDISEGPDTVFAYTGPTPPFGRHRYIFLVCKQLHGYQVELPEPPRRFCANIPRYIAETGLEVVGHTFFVSRAGGIPRPNDLPALTGAKGCASLFLVGTLFYEFFSKEARPDHSWTENTTKRGYAASIFFFILAGFNMVWAHGARGVFAAKQGEYAKFRGEFWWSRFMRLAPMYFLAFVLYLPFSVSVWQESSAMWPKPQNGALCMGLTSVGLQAWSPTESIFCSSPMLWVVSVVAFFNFTFPFVLLFLHRIFREGSIFAAIVTGILGVAAEIALWCGMYSILKNSNTDWSQSPIDPANLPYGSPLVRWPEFIMGMAIGALYMGFVRRHTNPGVITSILTDSITAAILCFLGFVSDTTGGLPFVFNKGYYSFGLWYWAVLLLVPLWILGLAFGKGITAFILSSRPMVWLGNRSYGIHLLQWHVLTYTAWGTHGSQASAIWDSWYGRSDNTNNKTLPIWSLPFLYAFTILAAALTHTLVERPLRRRLQNWLGPSITSDGYLEVNRRSMLL